jgi:hypothetical protein
MLILLGIKIEGGRRSFQFVNRKKWTGIEYANGVYVAHCKNPEPGVLQEGRIVKVLAMMVTDVTVSVFVTANIGNKLFKAPKKMRGCCWVIAAG